MEVPLKKLRDGCIQRVGQSAQSPQRRIRQAALDQGNVCAIEFTVERQFSLRPVSLDSEFFNPLSEGDRDRLPPRSSLKRGLLNLD